MSEYFVICNFDVNISDSLFLIQVEIFLLFCFHCILNILSDTMLVVGGECGRHCLEGPGFLHSFGT